MIAHVQSVHVGKIKSLGSTTSAIDKLPITAPVKVGVLGIEGDCQADLRVHGGADKAVHCYPWQHYAHWKQRVPNCALLNQPGAFGENLSVLGIDENDVCIGDQLRIGSVLFEVSQGRQPCFKLNLRFGYDDMATQVQSTLRAGWYFRVIEEGFLQTGDTIELVSRPHGKFTVAYLLALIRDRVVNPEELQPILELPLPESWRQLFRRRIANSQSEDWRKRLFGNI
jgi:MOSC domain-containing protein YiiM